MKILAVNAGSSSLKFKAYEMPEEQVLISGYFERIGIGNSFYTIKLNGEKIEKKVDIKNHTEAFELLMQELKDLHIVESFEEIKGVGHRVVQGGEKYDKSVVITDEVIKDVNDFKALAPLHNPPALLGIEAATTVIPNAVHVSVFDTAFHQTMSKENYLYALPLNWYSEYGVRKYGMHGTSHKYITDYMSKKLNRDDLKLIICHVGSGCSITAVKNGKSIDTSMGFTPNAGLVMGTRCGDIDASIPTYMMEKLNISFDEISHILNKESGLKALTDGYSDMRDVEKNAMNGDEKFVTALNIFIKKIVDYIAMYYFELEGADAIVFTAGVLENGPYERKLILDKLKFLGINIDEELNNKIASYYELHEGVITTEDSTVSVYVVPTDEEVMIARDTFNFTK